MNLTRLKWAAALACLAALAPLAALSQQSGRWSPEWEARFEAKQPTETILDSIGVRQGMFIAEIGAGNGRVAVKAAKRVGPKGRVYANDIDGEALEFMRERIKRERIGNMEVIEGTVTDPKLPAGRLDMIYVINTYHHFDDPVAVMKNALPALAKDGRFVIIEHRPEEAGGHDSEATTREEVTREAREAGYELVRILDFLTHDDIYILRAEPKPNLPVETLKLSDRVVVARIDNGGKNNMIAFKTKKGIVVVDTDISPATAAVLRGRIAEIFGRDDVKYVINTHAHGDHTWGNQVFAGAEIVAHDSCLAGMNPAKLREEAKSQAAALRRHVAGLEERRKTAKPENLARFERNIAYYGAVAAGLDSATFTPAPPTRTFADRMTLDCGDLTLHLVYFGTAHSASDILVSCPEEGVLLTGDLFVPKMNPAYVKTDLVPMIPRWIASLERAKADCRTVRHVLPGHGDFLTAGDIDGFLAYFKAQRSLIEGRESALPLVKAAYESSGIEAAVREFHELRSGRGTHYILEADFNGEGYRLLYEAQKPKEAVEMFKCAAEAFPDSWNAFDSLGEAYAAAEDTENAIAAYRKSLELNPDNSNATRQIERLQKK